MPAGDEYAGMLAAEDLFYEPEKESRTRSIARRVSAHADRGKFGEEQAPGKGETQAQKKNRLLSAKRRNYLLVVAFLMLLGDCVISLTFALMSPSDERTQQDYVSRKQLRTVYLQGFVALIDGLISTGVVIMVVHGVMSASLDVFLVAAAVKTSQATFFSLMQFGYPTVLRLSVVGFLLILRLASTWLIVRVAWISGILTTRPSKELPKVVRSLLEAGAIETGTMKNMDRPLSVGLVERLMGWLLPVKERTAAVGLGRVQVTVIAFFLLLMSTYMAFSDYWAVLGEQDEFFEEEQKFQIVKNGFAYLRDTPVPSVTEAKKILQKDLMEGAGHRVLVVVLSGLRYDALITPGVAALREWRESIASDSFLCKLEAEVPSLSLPNWLAIMAGVTPEVHGLLGNRAPPEPDFSSLVSVMKELLAPPVIVGTAWFVDLFRSHIEPLAGDGSVTASWEQFEALGDDAAANDAKRQTALLRAVNGTARLVVAQLSAVNSAGHRHGISLEESSPYGGAVATKAAFLAELLAAVAASGMPTTTVILSDHGHLERGGSGGASSAERDVPFLVHRHGSRLGSMGVCADGHQYRLVDAAPTIAAMLRVPAPRQSAGTYIKPLFNAEATLEARLDEANTLEAAGGAITSGGHGLRTWQWKDLYQQRHAEIEGFLSHPEVAAEASLASLDAERITRDNVAKESSDGWRAALDTLEAMFDTARAAASVAHSARNQALAFVVLLTMLAVMAAVMQLQTYCDPLAILPRKMNRGAADGDAFKFALLVVACYYAWCLAAFFGWTLTFGYAWDSSIVSQPENVRNFLFVTVVPGLAGAYLAQRALHVRYGTKRDRAERPGVQGLLMHCLVDPIESYERMDCYYLGLFYWCLCTQLAVCLLALLASQFSFILPLIFYSKYIDAETWGYRFRLMTLLIMSVPLQLGVISALHRWPGTRVDTRSMAQLHGLKVSKADRRTVRDDDEVVDAKEEEGSAALVLGSAVLGPREDARETMAERLEKRKVELNRLQQEKAELFTAKGDLTSQSAELQAEIDEVAAEAKHNQALIQAGIKGLEEMVLQRFTDMAEKEKADEQPLLAAAGGGGDGGGAGDDVFEGIDDEGGRDPLARRRARQARLVQEQRKRIAVEEREKTEAEASIRSLQQELTRLLEANASLQRKVDACEHNVLETREAIEDMEFQLLSVRTQKENQLAVLGGEVAYLSEHQLTVQRKSSELAGKMTGLESSLHAAEHQLKRVHHAQALATADHRRDNEALAAELVVLDEQFAAVKRDVKQLYEDKLALHQQLAAATAESKAAEETVANYRRGMVDLLDV